MEPTRLRFPGARRIRVELRAGLIGSDVEGASSNCPHCDTGLNLHQPDESSPEQLLATCDSCSRWYYLVELGNKNVKVLMIELPDKSVIEQAFAKGAPDPR